MIRFLDLKKINHNYKHDLEKVFFNTIDAGWYINGKKCYNFEKEFAKYCGTKFCVGVANGLDALTLILAAYLEVGKLKKGDEILVPANTYIASILAIINNDLTPILIEPDTESF
jgi:dTDP-4-amino-4,6-dideoxygalactose transaminase